jgi:D-arabinose 1-dehydrogenase-like Zn-dependent alcohol dehydrogenase
VRAVQQTLFRLYEAGKLVPHVMAAYPLGQYREALEIVRDRKAAGKVVLLMRDER